MDNPRSRIPQESMGDSVSPAVHECSQLVIPQQTVDTKHEAGFSQQVTLTSQGGNLGLVEGAAGILLFYI